MTKLVGLTAVKTGLNKLWQVYGKLGRTLKLLETDSSHDASVQSHEMCGVYRGMKFWVNTKWYLGIRNMGDVRLYCRSFHLYIIAKTSPLVPVSHIDY